MPISLSIRPMVTSTLLCPVLLHAVGVLGFPVTLKLERSFPTNHGVELKQHTKRDGLRHRRILHKYYYPNVVVGFGVLGTYDPFDVGDLSSQGIAPNSFSRCPSGGDGGMILVFGTPIMPDLVFTPLVKSAVLGFPVTLKLERSVPTNHGVELKQHTERDGLRHRRILHKYFDPNLVVGFGVLGKYYPFSCSVSFMISWALLGFKGHYFVIGPSFGQAHYGKDKMDLVIRCVSEGFSNFASEHLVTYPLAEVLPLLRERA
uniref:Uncharacterized protein n=1 Tax=Lactuca sativa TaxID=4236 RepID=A0A9R1WJB8_LACSA|nr:hypothetical protein LSAT_V11C100041540 [Lactuca sativa]